MPGITPVSVIKCDAYGNELLRYDGQILEQTEDHIVLEAYFSREDMQLPFVTLKKNDRFVETFYTDRWYNLFEIFDRDDGKFKGWYCNIGYPAVLEDGRLSYKDLALDVWVSPSGEQLVLDEDEFAALQLSPEVRSLALAGLDELKRLLKTKRPPND